MDETQKKKIEELLSVTFRDESLLRKALVHRSYAYFTGGSSADSNERLEFLGDAVLELIITDYLYRNNLEASEGSLSKARAYLVNLQTLAELAEEKGLGDFLLLSPEEEESGGREKPSILADAVEALIGAVYIDQGLEAARGVILELFGSRIDEAIEKGLSFDYKTMLQEWSMKIKGIYPEYLGWEEGPDHQKLFHSEVMVDGRSLGKGRGRTKKEAEQQAAREAYRVLMDGLKM